MQLALAIRLLEAGNEVIICGRDPEKLSTMKKKYPVMHTIVSDTCSEKDRIELWNWVSKEFPKTNVLINNAGIQRKVDLK